MNQQPKKNNTIGCCGIDCGLCPRYISKSKSACPGCGAADFFSKHPSCGFLTCCAKNHGLEVCRITSYNVCYTKLLRDLVFEQIYQALLSARTETAVAERVAQLKNIYKFEINTLNADKFRYQETNK